MLNTLDLLYFGHLEVFTAFSKTDVDSWIQILAPWRFCLEGMGSSAVPLSNALFKLFVSLIIACFLFVFQFTIFFNW